MSQKSIHSSTVSAGDIDAIIGGYHGTPADLLGAHVVHLDGKERLAIRTFQPYAQAVAVVDTKSGRATPMARMHETGFYEAVFARRKNPFPYQLSITDPRGEESLIDDPYRFAPQITEFELHLHTEGTFLRSYERFGAHMCTRDGVDGVSFAVWAPNAQRVSVVGPFNRWDERVHPMQCHSGYGVWELFVPNLPEGVHYKYAIRSQHLDYAVDKSDPYAFYAEMRPTTDSRVWNIERYAWQDQAWMEARAEKQALDKPLNIYEVHLGSWRRVPEDNAFLSYQDLAQQLVDYVTEMGYTHVELLPITEHPLDGSWGYQVTGYFAPTSRFGTPDEFMYFVDLCHQHDIGVILDWVPAHFPRDAHGLAFFDGTHLYEHEDPRQGEHVEWGTKIFNFGRNEVRNFLLSNALFWLEKYHLDGLRVDAVASMLYRDYARESDEWIPNAYGGRENIEAIEFLRRFNEVTHGECPGILTIAEESTSWPMVTRPTYAGGLGFDLKWNMGWMHDMLDYMQKEPVYRRYHQNEITFSLMYAFSENYVLPFSHDEVVHLKRSMLDKMPGDLWQNFANLRTLYGYMACHPGKKLLFMGSEFGQWTEWSEDKSLDWHLLEHTEHAQLKQFVATLNHLYRDEAALHQVDTSWEGFQWIDISDADQSIISFVRRAADPADHLVVVCNFTPIPRLGYRIGLPAYAGYREHLNSDWPQFGGSGVENHHPIHAQELSWQNCPYSAPVDLPPLGMIILKPEA